MKNTKLFDLFKQYAYGQNYATAFTEILDYFLITMKILESQEAQKHALEQLANYDKRDLHVAIMTEVGELAQDFNDPLGELYERLISKGQHGQFFTPTPITEFITASVIPDGMEPGQTVYDPCCGSGRMLLAAAKINRHLRFFGADIDIICCKMAVVNMLLNSLTGEIAHMDTLANDFHRGYKTSTILKGGYHYPYYTEFTDPEESSIWLGPVKPERTSKFDTPFNPTSSGPVNGMQGNLFEQL